MSKIGWAAFVVFVVLGSLSFVSPANTAHAQSRVFPTGYWGPLLSCTGNYHGVVTVGPDGVSEVCNDLCDLLATGQNVTDFATTLVLFVGVPVMISLGGVMLLISGFSGADEKRQLAKDIIFSTLIGAFLSLFAYVFVSTFLWLFGNTQSDVDIKVSWPNIVCEVPPL